MKNLKIYCEDMNLKALQKAFKGEFESDAPLCAELIFTDAEGIKKLNAEHRGKDAVTDVLSFPSLDGIRGKKIEKRNFPYDMGEDKRLMIGSIVICRERAQEQAEEFGHSYERELNYLIVHGLCHLLGYDHETEEDKREMRAKEERILGKLGITR